MTVASSPAGLPVTLDGVSGNGHRRAARRDRRPRRESSRRSRPRRSARRCTLQLVVGRRRAHPLRDRVGDRRRRCTATYHADQRRRAGHLRRRAGPAGRLGARLGGRFGNGERRRLDPVHGLVDRAGTGSSLGDLPVDGVLDALHGLLDRARVRRTRPGLHWEEIARDRSRRGRTPSGSRRSVAPRARRRYRWQVQALSGTTPLLMATVDLDDVDPLRRRRVQHARRRPRSITVTATMYSRLGQGPEDRVGPPAGAGRRRDGPARRSSISTTRPPGFATSVSR